MVDWNALFFLDRLRRSLWRRVAIRCWVAAFLCILSMLISPIEHAAGQAAFLPMIFVFIKPPSDPTIVFLYQWVLTAIFVAAEWAWCILGMKLSVLARNQVHDQRIFNSTVHSIYTHDPNATGAQIEGALIRKVFEGEFLQAGSSAVWAAFLFVGTYFALLIRVYNVKLFFIMVFAVILVSIFATIAPLIPVFFALPLSQLILVPFTYYCAAALFAVTFVFPTSAAETCSELLRTQSMALFSVFDGFSPSGLNAIRKGILDSTITVEQALKRHLEKRFAIISSFDLVTPLLPFLGREISIGNASGADIRELAYFMRALARSISGFSAFGRHIQARGTNALPPSSTLAEDEAKFDGLEEVYRPDDAIFAVIAALESSATTNSRFAALSKGMKALSSFYDRQTSWKLTTGVIALFSKRQDAESELASAISEIEAALRLPLDQIPSSTGSSEAQNTDQQIQSQNTANDPHPFQSYLHILYTESLAVTLAHLLEPLRVAKRIESQSVRIWFPWTSAPKGERAPQPPNNGSSNEDSAAKPNTKFAPEDEVPEKRLIGIRFVFTGSGEIPVGEDNPDRIQGMDLRQKETTSRFAEMGVQLDHHDPLGEKFRSGFLHDIVGFLRWLGGTESTFSLKIAILAVALACPAWITNNGTAKFYYDNKGAWALIMAMTAKGVYSSETTYGFVQRVVGAVMGATGAMVAWYISTGTTSTAGVVLGYSWIDETLPVAYNPGVGYQVYWRRLLLVVIGLTATWIIDLLPKPKTGREDLRKTYARTTFAIGTVAASVLTRLKQSSGPDDHTLHTWRAIDNGIGSQILNIHRPLP
ncbi:uncharacterized protein EI90DRAFT_907939 [Cantharellus anzutake]|uniref:uncharacterized protein n=1 Tax=Cantharellus anzutake TaxID=1750568 RepID=UPI001903C1B7|nr:uncharacterized protein EI90DRAFT_907939 [Cantharellus anzutake]KAF8331978.1 hypothetical protein EI90DRAFT_907939 [Cantharellus anzutake]